MNLKRIIVVDVLVISAVLFGGYLIGFDECEFLLKYDDIGTIIIAFGILWTAGSVMKFPFGGWIESIVGIVCGASTCLFGYLLFEYGFFQALIGLGIGLMVLGAIIRSIDSSPQSICHIVVLVGLGMTILGAPLMGLSKPTKKPDQTDRHVDVNAKWQIQIEYHSNGLRSSQIFKYEGLENEAYEAAQIAKREWKLQNPNKRFYRCRLICIWVPDWYARKYGWPTNPAHDNV